MVADLPSPASWWTALKPGKSRSINAIKESRYWGSAMMSWCRFWRRGVDSPVLQRVKVIGLRLSSLATRCFTWGSLRIVLRSSRHPWVSSIPARFFHCCIIYEFYSYYVCIISVHRMNVKCFNALHRSSPSWSWASIFCFPQRIPSHDGLDLSHFLSPCRRFNRPRQITGCSCSALPGTLCCCWSWTYAVAAPPLPPCPPDLPALRTCGASRRQHVASYRRAAVLRGACWRGRYRWRGRRGVQRVCGSIPAPCCRYP